MCHESGRTSHVAVAPVVTGAGSGIGRASAQALASRGLRVYCVGRRVDPLKETAELIGGCPVVVPADIGTERGVAAVRDAVGADTVTALVHAAGIEGIVACNDTSRQTFDELIATNLGGPFFLTQALPALGDGSGVVFVGSIAADRGRERHAAYSASKAALAGLTVNLAAELAPRVRVNCIRTGATQTQMLDQALTQHLAALSQQEAERTMVAERTRLLLGRVAEPAEVAASIVHLALDASYSTGTVLTADGGYTAR